MASIDSLHPVSKQLQKVSVQFSYYTAVMGLLVKLLVEVYGATTQPGEVYCVPLLAWFLNHITASTS